MPETSRKTTVEQATPAFDMKAGHFTVPTLLIRDDDSDALDEFLANQVAKLPHFFEQAPLVIDLSQYPSEQPLENFPMIVGMIRGHGMIPVGVRGASQEQREHARLLELAVMPRLRNQQGEKSVPAAPKSASPKHRPSLVVEEPVRSGQRIYAEGRDLVLLAGVSSGAEVMADGNIHAYGPVRGRMLAGVRENTQARIFCRDMGAELVAIAGRYRVNEDLPPRHIGRSVQISLQDNALQFASL